MTKPKMIPCRVCGKSFKPCGYCQSHSDTFRWRNFACSKECAEKYISDATAYREKQHKNKNITFPTILPDEKESTVEKEISKKAYKKKSIENTNTDTVAVDSEKNDKNNGTE